MNKIPENEFHDSFRGYFAGSLYNEMISDKDIYLLVGDLGYGMFDRIQKDFPDRFFNVGAAEQAMMGIAVGLALRGKKVFVYSITTFLLRRPYETIKLYIDHEKIPVRLVGGGRDRDYAHDGFSHDSTDAVKLFETLPNIRTYFPTANDKKLIPQVVAYMVKTNESSFISLRR